MGFLRAAARRTAFALAASLSWGAAGLAASSEPVAGVLSSDSPYYREALAGFVDGYGRKVPAFVMDGPRPRLPGGVQVAVAFGARAAGAEYPSDVYVVACMAPGLGGAPAGRRQVVRVEMLPEAATVLARLREVQPGLRNLAAFWVSAPAERYLHDLIRAGRPLGVDVRVRRLSEAGDLPAALRSLSGRPDAIWVPADPQLLNPESFAVLREYSWGNAVPLYAPTAGLVDKGATAAVTASYGEIGRAAARAARLALTGNVETGPVYPATSELFINRGAADRAGLVLPESVLRTASRVTP